jgi:hypothetical protein
MGRLAFVIGGLGLFLLGSPGVAVAQNAPPPLKLKANKPYSHPHSGLVVPETLGGMKRSGSQVYAANVLDVALQYETDAAQDAITIYIFRNVSGSVPIWFDRARESIEKRDKFGKATALKEPFSFAINGQNNASAMRATYALSGSGYKSTGLALVPLNGFYVKIRTSSANRSVEELDAWMSQIINELSWPKKPGTHPAAVAIKPCSTPLKFDGSANLVKQDSSNSILAGLFGSISVPDTEDTAEDEPQKIWCRDAKDIFPHGVYRTEDETDNYMLAVTDAGRAIYVGPDLSSLLLSEADEGKEAKPIPYSIIVKTPDTTLNFQPRDRLVEPSQVFQIIDSEAPSSSSITWGKKKGNISINTGG